MGVIEDGQGQGYLAGVNSGNQLRVQSESIVEGSAAALEKRLFLITTGDITLTDANPTAVLFFKYSGTAKLLIQRFAFTNNGSTGGDNNTVVIDAIRNPMSISGGTAIDARNRNFAGTDTLTATITKGATGETFTGGDEAAEFNIVNTGFTIVSAVDVPFVLEQNNSLGFLATPPTNNTSATYRFSFFCLEIDV